MGVMDRKYRPGEICEGKITGIQSYGAFVALDKGTVGLIHISEISDGFVKDIEQFVKVGSVVKVKVIDYDMKTDQARLSLKALHKPRVQMRRKPLLTRPVLPQMRKGFSSIRENMPRWIQTALEKNDE